MHEDHPQFDFSQITEHLFLGTNLCCLSKSHIQILLDIGITAEIDLEKEKQDPVPQVPIYLWLPTEDKTSPSTEQFKAGVSLIEQMVKLGKKVYVHCKNGHGRSPTLVAAYLISQGQTMNDSIEVIKKARPEAHLEKVQIEELIKYSSLSLT